MTGDEVRGVWHMLSLVNQNSVVARRFVPGRCRQSINCFLF